MKILQKSYKHCPIQTHLKGQSETCPQKEMGSVFHFTQHKFLPELKRNIIRLGGKSVGGMLNS